MAEESFPAASVAATSGAGVMLDGVAFAGAAAESFLSAAVVWSTAAGVDCAEASGLALPVASLADAAIDAGVGARLLEFGLRFRV